MLVKFTIAVIVIAMINAEHHDTEGDHVTDHESDHHAGPHNYEKTRPYHFGYNVADEHGMKHHYEESDGHGKVEGAYGYIDKDGINRLVEYVADEHGFRANIMTNEPGTINESSADTHVLAFHHKLKFTHHEEDAVNEDDEHHSSHVHEDEDGGHKYHD